MGFLMQLTEAEYTALRTAYLALMTGQQVVRVTLPSGATTQYHPKDLDKLAAALDSYEIANGMTHARTYARNLRRR